MTGKLILRLTILPSGKVTGSSILSSELANSVLEQRLLERIMSFDFGEGRFGLVTIHYPIEFLPNR